MHFLKLTGKILLIIIGIFIGLILLLLVIFYINNQKSKSYIKSHYNPGIPSIMHLSGAQWTDGSIDVAANWTYTYTTDSDRTTTYNSLIKSLQASGYEIATGSCPNDDYLTAVNSSADLYLTVSLEPLFSSDAPTSSVSKIGIEADRNNHDNVYIDPQALSCAQPNPQ